MIYILVLIALVALAIGLYFRDHPDDTPQRVRDFSLGVSDFYEGQVENLGWRRIPRQLPAQFRRWAAEAALAKRSAFYKGLPQAADDFIVWLAELPEAEASRFCQEAAAFCAEAEADLAWLVEADVERELKRGLEDVVLLYSLARWKAYQLKPLAAFKNWQADPTAQHNLAWGKQMYTHLVEAGLVSTPAELMLASEKERQAGAAEVIQQAAAQDSKAFNQLLRELAAETESPTNDRPQVEGSAGASPYEEAAAAPESALPGAADQVETSV